MGNNTSISQEVSNYCIVIAVITCSLLVAVIIISAVMHCQEQTPRDGYRSLFAQTTFPPYPTDPDVNKLKPCEIQPGLASPNFPNNLGCV